MQGEREELVKRVFPEIRHLCEQRGVVWGEVDLRWGVTDEQKAEDAVLPICLAEIERTRPYFIGMLGERYGWVPDDIPRDLADREAWLTDDRGRSVTELEILHGVLRDPEMAGHAYFYLRDPAFTAALPEPERAAYEEAAPEGRDAPHRPQGARPRVRLPGARLRRPARASATSSAPICWRWSTGSIRPPTTPDPVEQARLDQEAYAARLVANTIERRNDLIAVDVAVDADGPGVVVSGAPGGGVSTLLAAYAAERAARHPDELVLSYFVDAQRGEATERGLLAHLCRALGDDRPTGDLRAPRPDPARAASARPAAWCSCRRPAPDRARRRRRRLAALAARRRTSAWWPARGPARRSAGSSSAAWRGSTCSSSTPAQRIAAATTFLARVSRRRSTGTLLEQIAAARPVREPALPAHRPRRAAPARRPLHAAAAARHAARAGRPGGPRGGRARPLRARLRARPARPRRGRARARSPPSRTGLTEAELLDLLGDGARRPLSQLQLAAGSLIARLRRPPAARLRRGGRRPPSRRYLADAPAVHRRVGGAVRRPTRTSPRALEELPWQLLAAGDAERLRALLVDPPFIEAAYDTDRDLLARLWARLEETSAYRAATAYAPFAATTARPARRRS